MKKDLLFKLHKVVKKTTQFFFYGGVTIYAT